MSTFEAEYSNERILPNSGMALVGAILEQGGFREALNQLGVTDKRSGNQMKDGDLNSGFAVWAGRISRRFMRWTATRNFMSFVWARSVRLRKQPCARGWIKQEKADVGRFSRRTRKRSGATASGRLRCQTDMFPRIWTLLPLTTPRQRKKASAAHTRVLTVTRQTSEHPGFSDAIRLELT